MKKAVAGPPGFFTPPLGFFLFSVRGLVKKKQHDKSKKNRVSPEMFHWCLFLCFILLLMGLNSVCFGAKNRDETNLVEKSSFR
ncbi:hypothetical protein EGM70_09840 [Enterobacteriaceae bacterium 89]|nr:hypothetical protein [Enterobacteriaceae bacterium 89]